MTNYNWSPELETWVDILNTPVLQAPPTPDEFGDGEELASHQEALRLIKKDLNFVTQNAAEVQDEDDK
jgi:hypothetical protein